MGSPEPPELEAWQQQKARLHETITARQTELENLKAQRKKTPRHLPLKDLPQAEPFPRLRAQRKHFVDTIKLIAYRAETALVGTLRENLARGDDARALVRALMRTSADLHPDPEHKTLTVSLHPLPSQLQNQAVRPLAEELTATETLFPGTDFRLVFRLNGPTQFLGSGGVRLSSPAFGCRWPVVSPPPAILWPVGGRYVAAPPGNLP